MGKIKAKSIPRAVRVGSRVYTVKFVDEFPNNKHQVGECEPEKLTLSIKKLSSSQEMYSNLFHEILHASLAESGLTAQLSMELEESIVLMLERFLVKAIDISHIK